MANVKLKLIMERSAAGGSGGCSTYVPGSEETEWRKDSAEEIGALLSGIRETFGDRVHISVMDPRSIFSFFDLFRYRVRGTDPVWILNGRKVFEGVPSRDELEQSIQRLL
ncbi:hypothetical protein C8D99_105163 [Aminivibrio pyruvatiphilus]|jgi:hypothetical protein|uniref:Thioredoxin-like protein n=1 Tax=Aminivibrio pyruvatiphilus TaxID=1005740 RepID=A0A4R8M8B7_9BACT|nr:hypothetical protein [Aminivibrio pyruvatiphilus]TDY61750.1 hypothetical protein C8D99_105163 [Aminivibrio pyruvatiphilus]